MWSQKGTKTPAKGIMPAGVKKTEKDKTEAGNLTKIKKMMPRQ
ncbi:hypothetical protein [Mycoplasmopsis agalactiae]|nr:hypothetical protein [Mycoplasmopsis agalactiae]